MVNVISVISITTPPICHKPEGVPQIRDAISCVDISSNFE